MSQRAVSSIPQVLLVVVALSSAKFFFFFNERDFYGCYSLRTIEADNSHSTHHGSGFIPCQLERRCSTSTRTPGRHFASKDYLQSSRSSRCHINSSPVSLIVAGWIVSLMWGRWAGESSLRKNYSYKLQHSSTPAALNRIVQSSRICGRSSSWRDPKSST